MTAKHFGFQRFQLLENLRFDSAVLQSPFGHLQTVAKSSGGTIAHQRRFEFLIVGNRQEVVEAVLEQSDHI